MTRRPFLLLAIGIALASTLLLWSISSEPRIEWNRTNDGVNPNPYPERWYDLPFSEIVNLHGHSDPRVMNLEEAQLQLDELNFEIKIPRTRRLPLNFSVVGVIHTPPAWSGPRGFLGAIVPEKVILLISDKPITKNTTKLEFDLNGGISFEILDFYRYCPKTITSYRSWKGYSENSDMRLLLDRYPTMVSGNFVEACNVDEEVVYRVYGKYGTDELVSFMEHMLEIR